MDRRGVHRLQRDPPRMGRVRRTRARPWEHGAVSGLETFMVALNGLAIGVSLAAIVVSILVIRRSRR